MEESLNEILNEELKKLNSEKEQINEEIIKLSGKLEKNEDGDYDITKEEKEYKRDLESIDKEIASLEKTKGNSYKWHEQRDNIQAEQDILLKDKEQLEVAIKDLEGKYQIEDGKLVKPKELLKYESDFKIVSEQVKKNERKLNRLNKNINKLYEKYNVKEKNDYDKAWEEAIKENEKRDYDKAWEEAIKENEKRDYDKAWEEAIKENEQRDYDKAWEEAIKENEKRDYDKALEGHIEGNNGHNELKTSQERHSHFNQIRGENNIYDKPIIEKSDNSTKSSAERTDYLRSGISHANNNVSEEPEIEEDNIDASNNKDIDNDEIIGNNLNKENLVINIDVKKGIIETKLGSHKEKIKIKTLFKQMEDLYAKQELVTEMIPYIIENIDNKYHTSRLENFEGLYYLDESIDMNKYGNIDINFNLKNLYKIFRPSVPIEYQGKLSDMAKTYKDYGLVTVKTGLKTSMVNKIRSISKKLISLPRNRRIERLPANYKVVHDYEDEEVYEPDYEQGKESKKESIYDKYKVNNEHNEIEEQARKNMEGSADRSESSILSNGEKDF